MRRALLEEGPLGVREMRAVVRLSVIAGLCAVCDLNGSKERKRKERRRPAHRQFCGCLVLKSVRYLYSTGLKKEDEHSTS